MELADESNLCKELQTLKGRLKQTQDKVFLWLKDETKQLLRAKANQNKSLVESDYAIKKKHKASTSSRKKDNIQAEEKIKEYSQQMLLLKNDLEELHKLSLKETDAERVKCEVETTTIEKYMQETKEDIGTLMKDKQKLQYLQKAGSVFEHCLGMTFRKTTDSRMQVLFTNINEQDPQQEFYFFVKIQGPSRKYVVTDVGPEVEGLDELLGELNKTNNIRKFIIEMRKKFKRTLQNS